MVHWQSESSLPQPRQSQESPPEPEPMSHRKLTQVDYKYSTLPSSTSFRLLRMCGDNPTGPLQFELETHNLSDRPKYQAISYTWGTEDRHKFIQHRADGGQIHVTLNCEAALRSFASEWKPEQGDDGPDSRLVWIDSVCIDQDHINERNHQVGLMDRIFRQAETTLAHLNDAKLEMHATFAGPRGIVALFESYYYVGAQFRYCDTVEHIANRKYRIPARRISTVVPRARDTAHGSRHRSSRNTPQQDSISGGGDVAPDHQDVLRTLSEICDVLRQNPWFTRLWVVQEILLAKRIRLKVNLEPEDVEWSKCAEIFHEAPLLLKAKESSPDTIVDVYRKANQSRAERNYWVQKQAQIDSHDPPSSSSDIQRAAQPRGFLRYWQLADILQQTKHFGCADPRDKIWALLSLFRERTPRDLIPDYSLPLATVYTRVTRYLLWIDVSKVLLAAQGVNGDPSMPSWTVDWRNAPDMHDSKHRAGYVAGARRIIMGTSADPKLLILRGKKITHVTKVGTWFPFQRSKVPLEEPEPNLISKRSSIYLESGDCRFGPANTLVGDWVVILVGFEVPFVLRPTLNDTWLLVGSCYVDELMSGRTLADADWETVAATEPPANLFDFRLC